MNKEVTQKSVQTERWVYRAKQTDQSIQTTETQLSNQNIVELEHFTPRSRQTSLISLEYVNEFIL